MTNKLYAKNHFFRPTVQKVNRTRAVIVSVIRQSMHRLSKAEKNTKKAVLSKRNSTAAVSIPRTVPPR